MKSLIVGVVLGFSCLLQAQQATVNLRHEQAKYLTAMREPNLLQQHLASSQQVFRLIWIRTFHHPVAVRMVIGPGETGTVYVKELSGQGGYTVGRLIKEKAPKTRFCRGSSVLDASR
jgi:hypothetical protein